MFNLFDVVLLVLVCCLKNVRGQHGAMVRKCLPCFGLLAQAI